MSNKPAGAEMDSNAPYNECAAPLIPFSHTIIVELVKKVEIDSDKYDCEVNYSGDIESEYTAFEVSPMDIFSEVTPLIQEYIESNKNNKECHARIDRLKKCLKSMNGWNQYISEL